MTFKQNSEEQGIILAICKKTIFRQNPMPRRGRITHNGWKNRKQRAAARGEWARDGSEARGGLRRRKQMSLPEERLSSEGRDEAGLREERCEGTFGDADGKWCCLGRGNEAEVRPERKGLIRGRAATEPRAGQQPRAERSPGQGSGFRFANIESRLHRRETELFFFVVWERWYVSSVTCISYGTCKISNFRHPEKISMSQALREEIGASNKDLGIISTKIS